MITHNVRQSGIPVHPVVDDRFLLPGHIFGPWRDPVQPLTLFGVNDHLGK